MPHKDPADRRAYRARKRREDPERAHALDRAYYQRRKARDPSFVLQKNEQGRRWRKKNPEKLALAQRKCKLKRLYGLTLEAYGLMLAAQNGCCAICQGGQQRGQEFAVDHDHKTGAIRGLLCHNCNHMLCKAKDDPAVLRRAAEYLEW